MSGDEWLLLGVWLFGLIQGASLMGIFIGRGPFWDGWRDGSSLGLRKLWRASAALSEDEGKG